MVLNTGSGMEIKKMAGSESARMVQEKYNPVFTADCSIDGHSHIQSGATAPLPLIWNQMGNIPLRRSVLNVLGALFLPGGRVQRKTTEEIADELVKELEKAYRDCKLLKEIPYKSALLQQASSTETAVSIFSPCIIMPMDMDYAHIGGFPQESTTIYHEGTFEKERHLLPDKMVDGVYYRIRENAFAAEKDGKLKDVSRERPEHAWVFQAFKKQNDSTLAAVKKHPWILIPMFHYDPRRWCNPSGGDMDHKQWIHGPWDEPFSHIATSSTSGLFIGFKMYPPLGYKPFDERLRYLDAFYSKCMELHIPILAHCSPGGMTTHEAEFYQERDQKTLSKKDKKEAEELSAKRLLTYDPLKPDGYFFDEYVHPKNWRPVLEKYRDLKLCLAHFGGDEWDKIRRGRNGKGMGSDWVKEIITLTKEFPNVYTDLSCFDLEESSVRCNVVELFRQMKHDPDYKHLQDKIIFGVDWYLSLITKAPKYGEYVESFFDLMSDHDELQWYRSAIVNPATFYGLDDETIMKNMNKALEDATDNQSRRESGYQRIKKIKEQVDKIKAELEKLKT
jgi:predicted TIM-barrel fold metal-dependent hydrolase